MNSKCVILGNFNGHVGKMQDGNEGVHGGFHYGKQNVEGERVLEFADSLELKITNTWFKKEDENLITYESGGCKTAIDCILVGKQEKVKNEKAIPVGR